MNEKILSQEEVDSLLKSISSGEVSTEGERPEDQQNVTTYDFSQHEKVVKGKIPIIEKLADRFSQQLRRTFSQLLTREVEIRSVSSELKRFGDFLKAVPVAASIRLFRIEPLKRESLLVFDSTLIFTLIECMMGGTCEEHNEVESREFTRIENRLIDKIVRNALDDLEQAWAFLQPVQINLEGSETVPEFVSENPRSEMIICIQIEIDMNVAVGNLLMCLPHSLFEPYEYKQTSMVDPLAIEHLATSLKETEVTVSADLGDRLMTVREILDLRPGEHLRLDYSVNDPLRVKVEGVPKFWGLPGYCNRKFAVKIVENAHNVKDQGSSS